MKTSLALARRRLVLATAASGALAALPTGARAARAESLDVFIRAQMRTAGIPGLAVAQVRDGRTTLARGYGFADLARRRPVTPDSMFHIASVTKPVTATTVMQLVEQGRMRLDDPIDPWMDFPLRHPRHAEVPITFRHLLMHMSSVSDERYVEIDFRTRGADSKVSIETLLRDCLASDGRAFAADKTFGPDAPGSRWDYSNLGYALLGRLATRIGGEDMRQQAIERIFAPLGMRHVSWTIAGTPERLRVTPYDLVDGRLSPIGAAGFPDWSAGMLRASVADFAPFIAASANDGKCGDARICSPTTMREMLVLQQPPGLPAWLTAQGLGWSSAPLGDRSLIEHWGGDLGVFTAVYIDTAARSGVAVFTNSTATRAGRDAVKAIAARLLMPG